MLIIKINRINWLLFIINIIYLYKNYEYTRLFIYDTIKVFLKGKEKTAAVFSKILTYCIQYEIKEGLMNTQDDSHQKNLPRFLVNKSLPIIQTPIAYIVAERIKFCVMEGVFSSGQRLTETQLCEQMGVSRTTIRKAFVLLESEGVLEKSPGLGMTVSSLPESERNIFREVLDPLFHTAQRLAKGRISKKEAKQIQELSDEIVLLWDMLEERAFSEDELKHLQQLDFCFHQKISKASRNPLILECIEMIMKKPSALACYHHEDKKLREEHRKIHQSLLLSLGINS